MKKVFLMLATAFIFSACSRFEVYRDTDVLTYREHMDLAASYVLNNELDLALREYTAAIRKDPENPTAHFAIGNVYLRIKKFKDAVDSFSEALLLKPGNPLYNNNLCWAYMETGAYPKAVETCSDALKADPERAYIYLDTFAVVQMRSGDTKGAEESLKKAASLTPETEIESLREIYGHLIDLYKTTGQTEKEAEAREKKKELYR